MIAAESLDTFEEGDPILFNFLTGVPMSFYDIDVTAETCDHSEVENVPPEGAVCAICNRILFSTELPENFQDKSDMPRAGDLDDPEVSP